MWSLGCLCARMHLGFRLYCGKNEYEMESIFFLSFSFVKIYSERLLYVYVQRLQDIKSYCGCPTICNTLQKLKFKLQCKKKTPESAVIFVFIFFVTGEVHCENTRSASSHNAQSRTQNSPFFYKMPRHFLEIKGDIAALSV